MSRSPQILDRQDRLLQQARQFGFPKAAWPKDLLACAQHEAALGWRVYPVDETGRALVSPDDATHDPKQIAAWWRLWPTARVGCVP